jgi:hypothetical protein
LPSLTIDKRLLSAKLPLHSSGTIGLCSYFWLQHQPTARIHQGIHKENCKNEAFKKHLTEAADVLDAMQIFMYSPLTTNLEKARSWEIGDAVSSFRRGHANHTEADLDNLLGALS